MKSIYYGSCRWAHIDLPREKTNRFHKVSKINKQTNNNKNYAAIQELLQASLEIAFSKHFCTSM